MGFFRDLVIRYDQDIKKINNLKNMVTYKACREYRQENKKMFKIMDIVFILMFLFNIGALMLTNALVFKEKPNAELRESNPIQCDTYKCVNNKLLGVALMIKNLVIYAILVGSYIVWRNGIYTEKQFYWFAAGMTCCAVILSRDFFNNLGFLIGKLFWGV